jgi:hypothetical protein
MINVRLRRAGLPAVITAALAGVVLAAGTAHADTGPSAADAATAKAAVGVAAALPDGTAAATDERKFGDLTGDGKADLAAIDGSGTLWVYPGRGYVWDGQGTRSKTLFDARFQAGTGWGAFTDIVRHGDFNGDGKQDILTRGPSGNLTLYAGTGNRDQIVSRKGTPAGTGWTDFDSIAGPGDITGDGNDDLLGQQTDGDLVLYSGTGDAAHPFAARGTVVGTGWNGDLLTTMGDWTNDGRSELMFRGSEGALWVYRSALGASPYGPRYGITGSASGRGMKGIIGMGDLTSDAGYTALPDVLWQGTDGTLFLVSKDVKAAIGSDIIISFGWAGYRLF